MGQVRLVSDTWDFVAAVEVREGNYVEPESNTLVFTGSVFRGWVRMAPMDVQQCYRRCNNPSNANSGWTGWHCNSHVLSGIEDWFLT